MTDPTLTPERRRTSRRAVSLDAWRLLESLRISAMEDGMDDEQARRWALLAGETYWRQSRRRPRTGRERAVATAAKRYGNDTRMGRAILAKERAA